MEAKTLILLVLALFLQAYYGNAQPAVFDITKYGAVVGSDISQVFIYIYFLTLTLILHLYITIY